MKQQNKILLIASASILSPASVVVALQSATLAISQIQPLMQKLVT
nr:hypothetical protein [Mycoplasmopsis bovis]